MPVATTTVERAFELARAGVCTSMSDIARTLKRERCEGVDQHLTGASIRLQLRTLMLEARIRRAGREAAGSD